MVAVAVVVVVVPVVVFVVTLVPIAVLVVAVVMVGFSLRGPRKLELARGSFRGRSFGPLAVVMLRAR